MTIRLYPLPPLPPTTTTTTTTTSTTTEGHLITTRPSNCRYIHSICSSILTWTSHQPLCRPTSTSFSLIRQRDTSIHNPCQRSFDTLTTCHYPLAGYYISRANPAFFASLFHHSQPKKFVFTFEKPHPGSLRFATSNCWNFTNAYCSVILSSFTDNSHSLFWEKELLHKTHDTSTIYTEVISLSIPSTYQPLLNLLAAIFYTSWLIRFLQLSRMQPLWTTSSTCQSRQRWSRIWLSRLLR